jgi:hypothetical protein
MIYCGVETSQKSRIGTSVIQLSLLFILVVPYYSWFPFGVIAKYRITSIDKARYRYQRATNLSRIVCPVEGDCFNRIVTFSMAKCGNLIQVGKFLNGVTPSESNKQKIAITYFKYL